METALVPLSPADMLAPLREAVLALSPQEQGQALVHVRATVQAVRQRLREIDAMLEEQLLSWMEVNGDLQVSEDVRLYIGREKRVKCRDVGACLAALEEAAQGEIGKVVGCLAASPFKYGAARALLKEKYLEHFSEALALDVKTGNAVRVVKEANEFTPKQLQG